MGTNAAPGFASKTPVPSQGQTQITMEILGTTGGLDDVYTVPAGKTLFVYGYTARFLGAAVLDAYNSGGGGAPFAVGRMTTNQPFNTVNAGVPLAQIQAGDKLQVQATTNMDIVFYGVLA